MMNYKTVILGVIILYTVLLLTSLLLRGSRQFIKKVHSSKDDEYSWTRYTGSFIMVFCVYVVLAQLYIDGNVNETLVLGMLSIAFTGKVAQRTFSESNGSSVKKVSEADRI